MEFLPVIIKMPIFTEELLLADGTFLLVVTDSHFNCDSLQNLKARCGGNFNSKNLTIEFTDKEKIEVRTISGFGEKITVRRTIRFN